MAPARAQFWIGTTGDWFRSQNWLDDLGNNTVPYAIPSPFTTPRQMSGDAVISGGGRIAQISSGGGTAGRVSLTAAAGLEISGGGLQAQSIYLGEAGDEVGGTHLTISNGGSLEDDEGWVTTSNHSALVSGQGSVWNNHTILNIGADANSGWNLLQIRTGGKVTSKVGR